MFVTVLHRLLVSGSDRACEYWRDDYRIEGLDKLDLHHLYRAMAWLAGRRSGRSHTGTPLHQAQLRWFRN
jgi:hypothetical protein